MSGVNGQTGVARVCPAKAGSILSFEFRIWPDASQPGSIDISHKGPCAVYMKSVQDATASNNAVGDGWFKIFSEDYDSSAGKWCTEKLIDNDGHLSVSIPNGLAAGYYLVRPELLALQQADKTPADPQFYVGCAQIFLSSTGTSTPKDTVEIPGYISFANNNAALTFSLYDQPMKLPYPMFGPPVYTASSSSKRSISRRAMQQTQGLEPANCVLQNVNWCGIEIDSYSDETGCWDASTQCWDQATTCYNSSGPTGSKNCPTWETKCKGIQAACNAGNFNGPPDAGKVLTPPLETPDNLPAPSAYGGEDTTSVSSTSSSSSSSSVPVASPISSSSSSSSSTTSGTSTDTCGSNGGLTCVQGSCCSSHGYCGTSDDYCGTGCQGGFGTCSSSTSSSSGGTMKKRHLGRHIRGVTKAGRI